MAGALPDRFGPEVSELGQGHAHRCGHGHDAYAPHPDQELDQLTSVAEVLPPELDPLVAEHLTTITTASAQVQRDRRRWISVGAVVATELRSAASVGLFAPCRASAPARRPTAASAECPSACSGRG